MALNIHVRMIECGAKRDHLIHHFWGKFYKILIIKIINNLLTDYFVVVSIQTGMLFCKLSLPMINMITIEIGDSNGELLEAVQIHVLKCTKDHVHFQNLRQKRCQIMF